MADDAEHVDECVVALENENKLGCGGSMLMIEVIDTGIGVNGKVGSELFNVFSQAQRGQISGTGLGLFGIRVRAEGLNGMYGVHGRSDGHQGSVFWFKIPYVPDNSFDNENSNEAVGSVENSNVPQIYKSFRKYIRANFKDRVPIALEGDDIVLNLSVSGSDEELRKSARVIKPGSKPVLAAANSEYGTGSTVKTTKSSHSDEESVRHNSRFSELTVFVVDDSPAIRKLMMRTLRSLGVDKIELYVNGDEALQSLLQKEVDCVFMDIQMPIMTGPEAARRFREFEATSNRSKRQRIVAISANFWEGAQDELVGSFLFDDMHSKPLRLEGIQACLEACLLQQ